MSSPLKVLVDVGVGKAVEQWFAQEGHDVKAVRAKDAAMEDRAILAWALEEERLVVTMDKDFGELVYQSGEPHAGVLLLRLEAAKSAEKAKVVEQIVTKYGGRLKGAFAIYRDGRLRLRKGQGGTVRGRKSKGNK